MTLPKEDSAYMEAYAKATQAADSQTRATEIRADRVDDGGETPEESPPSSTPNS